MTAGEIALCRQLIEERDVDLCRLRDDVLARVIDRTGDVDLAAAALTMNPWPGWVRDLTAPAKTPA